MSGSHVRGESSGAATAVRERDGAECRKNGERGLEKIFVAVFEWILRRVHHWKSMCFLFFFSLSLFCFYASVWERCRKLHIDAHILNQELPKYPSVQRAILIPLVGGKLREGAGSQLAIRSGSISGRIREGGQVLRFWLCLDVPRHRSKKSFKKLRYNAGGGEE